MTSEKEQKGSESHERRWKLYNISFIGGSLLAWSGLLRLRPFALAPVDFNVVGLHIFIHAWSRVVTR